MIYFNHSSVCCSIPDCLIQEQEVGGGHKAIHDDATAAKARAANRNQVVKGCQEMRMRNIYIYIVYDLYYILYIVYYIHHI